MDKRKNQQRENKKICNRREISEKFIKNKEKIKNRLMMDLTVDKLSHKKKHTHTQIENSNEEK